jgi:transcriptional regulator with XRE-family HTH domain
VDLARAKIDVSKLYDALNEERTVREFSWRQLAAEIGVSPSLLSRLGNGLRPDVDAFVTLVRWLGMSAEDFMTDASPAVPERQPELSTQVAALLRARPELDDTDRDLLQDIFRTALKHVRANSDK